MSEDLKVSHSKVKTWRRCKQAYNNKYVRKLYKRTKSHALNCGIIFHECKEEWANGKSYSKVLKDYTKKGNKLFDAEKEEFFDSFGLAKGLIDNYVLEYEGEQDTYQELEVAIDIPLMEGVRYIGYIDALVNENDGLWLMETKTCKKFFDSDIMNLDIQTCLYRWALPQMGYETPRGKIWDLVRKKIPVVPELMKKGGLSQNRKLDTTYLLYLQAIHDNDLDEDDYNDMLSMLEQKENNFQRRVRLPFSKRMETMVMEDFKQTAIEIKHLGETLNNKNITRDCSWCDYRNLCQAELQDLDVNFIIKKEFTTKEQRDAQEKRKEQKASNKKISKQKGKNIR